MRSNIRRVPAPGILTLCSIVLLGSSSLGFAQETGTQVIVFGDSLSDPGNGFAFVKASSTPPDFGLNPLLIPRAPYAKGGHHLTNGATWIEQLAGTLGKPRDALAAFASNNPHAMNVAIGTARARNDGVNPSLSFQVAAFLQKTGGQVPSDALYVIAIGGNDVSDALISGNPAQALAILQAAAEAIQSNIALLRSLGAQHFLVWNVPNVGLTPAARLSGTTAVVVDGELSGKDLATRAALGRAGLGAGL